MRVEMRATVHAGIENSRTHKPAPKQRRPIVWPRRQRLLIKQAVIACGERVVRNHLHAGLGKPAKLIEVSKGVEECGSPRITSAGSLSGFSNPHRLSWLELVPEFLVKRASLVSARQPI